MQLHHLRTFVVLAEELNFRRAADRLCITEPGLSEQLRQLERQLGCRLFDRDRSGTRLSTAGYRLLPVAVAAAGAVDDLVAAARSNACVGSTAAGHQLRVGIVVDGIGERTWSVLEAFNKQRPDVEIDVRSLRFAEAADAIDRGKTDVVMQMGPSGNRTYNASSRSGRTRCVRSCPSGSCWPISLRS